MGKQRKGPEAVRINVRKGRREAACGEELAAFFACIARAGLSADAACARDRAALTACATAAARQPRVVNTVNFHLQRISRLMK
jgi:hypothetical protein